MVFRILKNQTDTGYFPDISCVPSYNTFPCSFIQITLGSTTDDRRVKTFSIDNQVRKHEIGFPNNIVYPEIYDLERNRRSHHDQLSESTLILRALNATLYIEIEANEELQDVAVYFNDGFSKYEDINNSCHFHGRIVSKPTGLAAISTCSKDGKMTGVLVMKGKTHFLSPSNIWNHVANEHFLHECVGESAELCEINYGNSAKGLQIKQENNLKNTHRVKRDTPSAKRKVIEVAVFADNEFYKKVKATSVADAYKASVTRVLDIMNQVQLIYKYSSLLSKFKIVVVKIHILTSSRNAPNAENGNMSKYLSNFCIWQSNLNPRVGTNGHWDHAIMLTGKKLFDERTGGIEPNVLGVAYGSSICDKKQSCSLSIGTDFEAPFVVAHEIAHSLGAHHDGYQNKCDPMKFMMSSTARQGHLNWSSCSNTYIKNFLGSGRGTCLQNDASPPSQSFDLDSRALPGTRYSLTDQCTLALGQGYKPYKSSEQVYKHVCQGLVCARGSFVRKIHPALEGSPCDTGKICLEGLCRPRQHNTRQSASGGLSLRNIQAAWINAMKNQRRAHSK